jgi:hypothetical protein
MQAAALKEQAAQAKVAAEYSEIEKMYAKEGSVLDAKGAGMGGMPAPHAVVEAVGAADVALTKAVDPLESAEAAVAKKEATASAALEAKSLSSVGDPLAESTASSEFGPLGEDGGLGDGLDDGLGGGDMQPV